MKITAAIIGLGQIGMGYDYLNEDGSLIFTHAQALARHDAYELVWGIDPDDKKRNLFEKKFHAKTYSSLEQAKFGPMADLVCIASPTMQHLETVRKVLEWGKPKYLLLEKPLGSTLAEAEEIARITAGIPTVVNYFRRSEPGIIELKAMLDDFEIYKGIVFYSKGLTNNASHFINLLQFFWGDEMEIQIIQKNRSWQNGDPEPDFLLKWPNREIIFFAGREENFSLADMRLIGNKGQIQYDRGKVSIYKTVPDPLFPGYTFLENNPTVLVDDTDRYQWHVMEELAACISGKRLLSSDIKSAVATMKVIERIKEELYAK